MPTAPIAMFLTCPICHGRHIDEGEFATKVHHTHACQHCGLTWRPAIEPTVGVQFLPGFKNAPLRLHPNGCLPKCELFEHGIDHDYDCPNLRNGKPDPSPVEEHPGELQALRKLGDAVLDQIARWKGIDGALNPTDAMNIVIALSTLQTIKPSTANRALDALRELERRASPLG